MTGNDAVAAQVPAALEVRDVTKSYPGGVVALDDVSLRIARGDAVAIVGASGSGKSTLLHIMGTLDAPTRGQVLLNGRSTGELADRRLAALRSHHLGFVFQHFHLSERLNATDNVASGLLYNGVPRHRRRAMAQAALERVGLAARATNFPHQLSGGERQRVAIARAVAHGPLVILADEPTGALDSRTGSSVLELLLELNESGTTLVIITHDGGVAGRLPARVEIADGRILGAEGLRT